MADYLKTEALKDIADAFEATTKVLTNHTQRLGALERNVDDLFDMTSRMVSLASRPVRKTPNKRVLILAVGVGVYVGYKLAEKNLNERKKEWSSVLRDKQPAEAKPKTPKETFADVKANQADENGKDAPQS